MSIRSMISVISTVAALSAFGAVVTPSVANAGVSAPTAGSTSVALEITGWFKDGHWHHPDCGFCTL